MNDATNQGICAQEMNQAQARASKYLLQKTSIMKTRKQNFRSDIMVYEDLAHTLCWEQLTKALNTYPCCICIVSSRLSKSRTFLSLLDKVVKKSKRTKFLFFIPLFCKCLMTTQDSADLTPSVIYVE